MHEGHGSKQRNKSEWFPQNKQWLSLNRMRDLSAVVGDFLLSSLSLSILLNSLF